MTPEQILASFQHYGDGHFAKNAVLKQQHPHGGDSYDGFCSRAALRPFDLRRDRSLAHSER